VRSRAIAGGVASLALSLAGVISVSSPASAQSLTIDCSDYGLGSIVSTSADAGETITFTLINCSTGNSPFIAPYTAGITDPQFTGVSISTSTQVVSDYSIAVGTPDGSYTNVFRLYDALIPANFEIYISVTVPRQASSEVTQQGPSPEPVQQQVGLPASGSCDDITETRIGSQVSISGGWGPSWEQWMNDGLGGPICTRMLVFSNSQSRWVLAD